MRQLSVRQLILNGKRARAVMAATMALACVAATTAATAATPTDATKLYVDASRPGETVKLYASPGDKEGVMDAPTLPLLVEDKSERGYYPVHVNGKLYWVDGLKVKVIRDVKTAHCSAPAGTQAAATLGAATNRCQ